MPFAHEIICTVYIWHIIHQPLVSCRLPIGSTQTARWQHPEYQMATPTLLGGSTSTTRWQHPACQVATPRQLGGSTETARWQHPASQVAAKCHGAWNVYGFMGPGRSVIIAPGRCTVSWAWEGVWYMELGRCMVSWGPRSANAGSAKCPTKPFIGVLRDDHQWKVIGLAQNSPTYLLVEHYYTATMILWNISPW